MNMTADQFFGQLISVRAEQRGWIGTSANRGDLHRRDIECMQLVQDWRERSPSAVNFWEICFASAVLLQRPDGPPELQQSPAVWRGFFEKFRGLDSVELAHALAAFLLPKGMDDDPRARDALLSAIDDSPAMAALAREFSRNRGLLAGCLTCSAKRMYPDLFVVSSASSSARKMPWPAPQRPSVEPPPVIVRPGPVRSPPSNQGRIGGGFAPGGLAEKSSQTPAEKSAQTSAASAPSDAVPARSPQPAQALAQAAVRPADWVWRPPDPAVPPAPAQEWSKSPDGFARWVDSPDALLVAATVRGRGHKQDGLYGDDAFALGLSGGWRILVVSDGAGSAKLSRFGSHLATTTVLRLLVDRLQTLTLNGRVLEPSELATLDQTPELARLRDCICDAYGASANAILAWVAERNAEASGRGECRAALDRAIREGASTSGKQMGRLARTAEHSLVEIVPTDCNATLLVAVSSRVLVRSSDGSAKEAVVVASCAIGDGMIAVFRRAGGKPPHSIDLMVPDAGAFSGESVFLSQATARPEQVAARVRFHIVGSPDDVVAIAAMTDGVADDYYGEVVGMNRLHCDLIANNLIPTPISGTAARPEDAIAVVEEELLCEQAGGPGSPGARRFPIAYSDRRLSALGRTPDDALRDPAALSALAAAHASKLAALGSGVGGEGAGRGGRMRDWLDTYRAKGSYDDRTLALCLLRGAKSRS